MDDELLQQPVLIAGAGPVGLSLAVALIHQGIPVEVFEALPELSTEIRASTFHPATLEMFAEWGVVKNVLTQGQMVDRLTYWERSTRAKIAEFHYSAIAADTTFPYRLQCPQSVLTRILRPLVEQSPLANVHMAHKLVAFEDSGTHVETRFETPTGHVTMQGAYLCGTDGSRSVVRKQLGLSFEGKTYEDRFLLIGTDLDLTPYFPEIGPVNYMYDPKEWVIILHLPDVVRIVFRLREDEGAAEAMMETAVRQRIARFLETEADYNIKHISNYNVHQRVAETFRVGRVLLAGDAAHINNPSGGMGMNSGIHDAYHLAPKLAAVLTGEPDSLLDKYSRERRQVAMQMVQNYSDKNYRDLAAQSTAEREKRNAMMRATAADPVKARAYLLRASMLDERI